MPESEKITQNREHVLHHEDVRLLVQGLLHEEKVPESELASGEQHDKVLVAPTQYQNMEWNQSYGSEVPRWETFQRLVKEDADQQLW